MMAKHFPFLLLCEENWKSQRIAIDNYPSWYSGWTKHLAKVEPTEAKIPRKRKREISGSNIESIPIAMAPGLVTAGESIAEQSTKAANEKPVSTLTPVTL